MNALELNRCKHWCMGAVQAKGLPECARFYSTVTILAVVVLMSSQGCAPQYAPVYLETPDGRVMYVLTTKAVGRSFYTRLTRQEDGRGMELYLEGKAEAMALSPDGGTLAVALTCFSKQTGLPSITHRVAMVRAGTLRLLGWPPITMPHVAGNSGAYVRMIVRLDRLALSPGSKTLATYFWKPLQEGGYESVVALWDTETGCLLRELRMPEPDARLRGQIHGEGASSMAFSEDEAFLGVSGAWRLKHPDLEHEQPDGFIRVWRLSDGRAVATLRPKGLTFVRNLCFDGPSHHVAAWHWIGEGTQRSAVTIWALPEGEQTRQEVFGSRIRSITWTEERDGFEVWTDQRTPTYMPVK